MNNWSESDFLNQNVWYHSTSAKFFNCILEDGIIASVNADTELDFGYGFYLTPSIEWAKKYAEGFIDARILEFHFSPKELLGEDKNYKFFGHLDNEFAEFVYNNRANFLDFPSKCPHNYLMVGGVMSDGNQATDFEAYREGLISKEELFRRLCLPKEDWQVVIHSQELCDKIAPYAAYDLKGGSYDVNNYCKTNNRTNIII